MFQAEICRTLVFTLTVVSICLCCISSFSSSTDIRSDIPVLTGRIVAVGIPGAGAVSGVGYFHPGGPICDKPTFRSLTRPGAVLDPDRILVASSSNFGAPMGNSGESSGAVLSIDPRSDRALVIPPTFAVDGTQASCQDGRIILFTANSPAFLNRVHNPEAATSASPSLTAPTGISVNNAFGRIWITSMPFGPTGIGNHSVLDPDGCPLAQAPDKVAGGVFVGELTNRTPQLAKGAMRTGAIGTALLGKSPDGSGRAVFAGLSADGSIVQVHVEQGVDGLAPPRTIRALTLTARISRAGMVLNWVPNMILFVADPAANSIVALSLRANGKLFYVENIQRLTGAWFNLPVDLAPAVPETASSLFSSNTTLAGGSDIYVANRGNGTITRIKQDGTVVAIRKITLPGITELGRDQLNGVAVSSDARYIWITISRGVAGFPDGELIEVPAFGASSSDFRN